MEIIPENNFKPLNDMLLKKKSLLLGIKELTLAQTNAITDSELERLNVLIKEKQQRIDEIDLIDEEFSKCFLKIKSQFGISGIDELDLPAVGKEAYGEAKQLKSLTSEIMDIIRDISETEKINSQKSKSLLEHFQNEIRKINQGKKANNAYMPKYSGTPSYFVDKKK